MNHFRPSENRNISGSFLLFLCLFSVSCRDNKPVENKRELIENSLLGECLLSADSRDSIYAASSYLQKYGPSNIPSRDFNKGILKEWQEHGKKVLVWLESQDISTVKNLIDGFPEFLNKRSPTYPPGGGELPSQKLPD